MCWTSVAQAVHSLHRKETSWVWFLRNLARCRKHLIWRWFLFTLDSMTADIYKIKILPLEDALCRWKHMICVSTSVTQRGWVTWSSRDWCLAGFTLVQCKVSEIPSSWGTKVLTFTPAGARVWRWGWQLLPEGWQQSGKQRFFAVQQRRPGGRLLPDLWMLGKRGKKEEV